MPPGSAAAAAAAARAAAERRAREESGKHAGTAGARYAPTVQGPRGDDETDGDFAGGNKPTLERTPSIAERLRLLSLRIVGGDKLVAFANALNEPKGFVRGVLLGNRSWFVFSRTNPFRVAVRDLVAWPWFDRTVLFLIFANCVFLAIDDPTCKEECEKTNSVKVASAYAEYVFTALFTIELVCQTIAKCLVATHGAYLTSPWNWLDFVIVITSYQFVLPGGGTSVTGLRAFRAMRPLRTITNVPGMRLLVNTLIESVPLMLDVLVLIGWVFGVFGIVGMELFMGKLLKRCYESDAEGAAILKGYDNVVCSEHNTCPGDSVCKYYGRNPNNNYTSFDNFYRAFLQVFQTFTLQGWSTDLMYHTNDGAGHALSSIFFVFLVMFGAFFALNLLTAIISAKFAQIHAEQAEEAKLEKQREKEHERLRALRSPTSPSAAAPEKRSGGFLAFLGLGSGDRAKDTPKREPPWRPSFRRIVESNAFSNFITACILINTILMAMDHHPMEKSFEDGLEWSNMVLSIIFFVEFIFKHLGMSLGEYWSNGFNAMDGVIVGAWVAEIMLGGGGASGLQALRTLRLLRVLRSMKLLRQFKELRRLMLLVIRGFIALKDFFLLLALFLFIFGVLGMQIFGGTEPFENATGMMARKNFNNIWLSCYTVFELLTGANWFYVMWLANDAVGEAGALYFILWIICGHFVLLTLFLAILITNFQSADEEEKEETEETQETEETEETVKTVADADEDGSGGDSRALAAAEAGIVPKSEEADDVPERRLSTGFVARVEQEAEVTPERFLAEMLMLKKWLISIGWTYGVGDDDEEEDEGADGADGEEITGAPAFAEKVGFEEGAAIMYGMAPAAEVAGPDLRDNDDGEGKGEGEEDEGITLAEATGRMSPSLMASGLDESPAEADARPKRTPPRPPPPSHRPPAELPNGERVMTPRERDVEELILAAADGRTREHASGARAADRTLAPPQPHAGAIQTKTQRAPRSYDVEPPRRHVAARGGRDLNVKSTNLVVQKREDVPAGTLADGLLEYPLPKEDYVNHLTLPTWEPSGLDINPYANIPGKPSITQQDVMGREVAEVFRRRTLENVKLKIAADLSFGVDAVLPRDFLGDFRRAAKDGSKADDGGSLALMVAPAQTKDVAGSPQRDFFSPYDEEPVQLMLPYSGYEGYGMPRKGNRAGAMAMAAAVAKRNQVLPIDGPGPVTESYAGHEREAKAKVVARSAFQRLLQKRRVEHTLQTIRRMGDVQATNRARQEGGPVVEAVSGGAGARAAAAAQAKKRREKKKAESGEESDEEEEAEEAAAPAHLSYRALFFLAPDNRVRQFFVRLVSSKYFEGVVLVLILFSSSLLAVDGPTVEDGSKMREFLSTCDTVFTIVFLIEFLCKVIAMGFVLHPGSYLRNAWNQLDFVIVASSMVTLIINDSSLSIIRTFRLMRVLRPLRMISRLKGMQIVITVLVRAMPACSSIVVFGLFEFGVFGILGVTLFKGGFSFCNDAITPAGWTVRRKDECLVGQPFVCTPREGDVCNDAGAVETTEWKTHFLNFDNIGNGVMSLFVVATLDDWMRVSYGCMDCRGIDAQPQVNINPYMGLYVIMFVFVGSFFWVNLLVGVIIDHYSQLIAEEGSGAMLTKEQQRWQNVLKLKEIERQSKWRDDAPKAEGWFSRIQRECFLIAFHPKFELMIMACIMMNVLSMALAYEGMGDDYKLALEWLNKCFTIVFCAEFCLKVTALNFLKYMLDSWNRFDFLIVCLSVPELFTDGLPGASVFRIFRIGRMFKLVQSARGLRTLFNTLISSLPAIGNVGSLLFLLMFIYSVLGMNLYGEVPKELALAGINRHANFNTFGAAMMTLFRIFTGDSWSSILEDIYNRGTQPKFIAPLFLISFTVFASLIMLNLIIAVILDQFLSEAGSEGLLQSNNFFDVLRKKMLLDRFVTKVRVKTREFVKNNPSPGRESHRRKSSFARFVSSLSGRQSD